MVDRAAAIMLSCTREQDYSVRLVDGLLDARHLDLAATLSGHRNLVVTTPTVGRALGPQLRAYARAHALDLHVEELALSEDGKRLDTAARLCDLALHLGLGRADALVALGGGVCCDIVSVAASLLRRGTPFVCLPTTLLAQVDAGIGVKGAVNVDGHKNALGMFQAPRAVLMDPAWLRTLPLDHVSAGMAEVLKIAAVTDADLFALIEEQAASLVTSRLAGDGGRFVIHRSIELMLDQLSDNWFEDRSFERLVDFGHTFSPTLETRSGFRLSHGEAVAIDMGISVALGQELGLTAPDAAWRLVHTAIRLGLPTWSDLLGPDLMAAAVATMSAHRGGRVNLVVPTDLGRGTFVTDAARLTPVVVERALTWLAGLNTLATRPAAV